MKHPHCNRSLSAHLFWCRGFAPVFFIVSVALIVVAVGSGFYFMSRPDAAFAPVAAVIPQEQVAASDTVNTEPVVEPVVETVANPTVAVSGGTPSVVSKTEPVVTAAPKVASAKPVDCGAGTGADACMFEHIATCTAAKAVFVDESTGVRVEHIVDGLIGGKCLYRSTIVEAPGQFAMLEGLDVQCNLPKEQLMQILQATEEAQLLQFCTGSYVDILRQARGMEPIAQ